MPAILIWRRPRQKDYRLKDRLGYIKMTLGLSMVRGGERWGWTAGRKREPTINNSNNWRVMPAMLKMSKQERVRKAVRDPRKS